jgi:acetyl-CoA acetyltransferase
MAASDYTSGSGKAMARRLFDQAGVRPADVGSAQIYDHFSPFVLVQLESLGFCGEGDAGAFVEAGHIRWPDGSLPVNTSGGHLSEAYIHGLNLAVEAVRQVRGDSTSQVERSEIALAACGSSAILFGR